MSEAMTETITAVVCTRDRAEDLARSIPSILQTDADVVMVVDQSGDTRSRQVLEAQAAWGSDRLVYVRSDERGAARGRNCALRACVTDLLVYTDDDCTVPPDWTHSIRHVMRTKGYDLLFAPVLPPGDHVQGDGWVPTFTPTTFGRVGPDVDPIGSFGFTANMAMRTALRDTVGLFDVSFGPGSAHFPVSEDTDYAYRAYKCGHAVGVEGAPGVVHHGVRFAADRDRLRHSYQASAGAMLDKHRRLGDRVARRRELEGVVQPVRQALGNAVRLRRPSGLRPLASFVAGVRQAQRLSTVDVANDVLVPKDGA
jgi:hypothetical protein